MKRLWLMVSSLAVIVLLLAAVGAGWLVTTGQLDAERIDALRSAWSGTTSDDPQGEVSTGVEGSRPGSSERRLSARQAGARQVAVDRQALQQEAIVRQRQIDNALEELAGAREELDRERMAFEAAKLAAAEVAQGRDEQTQFRRSVQLMEAAQPLQAKIWLLTMVDEGRFQDAVATLDAMRERSATRILREFQSGQELELAGKLLEALGRYGTSMDSTDPEETRQRVSHSGGILSEP